jgi:pyruvate formate lyase activating enzyme
VGLDRIIENATWLGTQPTRVWIRTAIIPGYTDQEANVSAVASFIRDQMPNVERWDLLCYNNLSISKWKRLDMHYELEGVPLVSAEKIEKLAEIAKQSGVQVRWSGVVEETAQET